MDQGRTIGPYNPEILKKLAEKNKFKELEDYKKQEIDENIERNIKSLEVEQERKS
jgi:hypothetical protein